MTGTLIRNAMVLSMDPDYGDFRGDVLIDGEQIHAMGHHLDVSDAEIVDGTAFILTPGFINAHIHTWQTALRSIASNWALPEYLKTVHSTLAEKFGPRDIYVGTLAGALNQLDCGTTTVADWCHNNPTPEHTDAAISALVDAGIRATFMHGTPRPSQKMGETFDVLSKN
jgi:cytosine/adenosine deaminase-related metal-dependent hydrolase